MRPWCVPQAVAGLGPRRPRRDYMTEPAGVAVSLVRLKRRDGFWLDGLITECRRHTAHIWVRDYGRGFARAAVDPVGFGAGQRCRQSLLPGLHACSCIRP